MTREAKIWTCKIGEVPSAALPDGADAPMRDAVARAYAAVTGEEPLFIFSGWGGELDESERAVVENREPSEEYRKQRHIRDAAPDAMTEAREKAKFTPGPWGYDPCVSMHDRPDLPCIVDRDRHVVAQCWDDGHSEAECEANARLIAAAPDLYEALKAAEGHLAETLSDARWHPIGKCPVLELVRAALSKAEGASQ